VPSSTEVAKGRHARLGDQDDVAAIAAVAAVWATPRYVSLATEGTGAVAAVPGRHVDADVVSEHGRPMIATGLSGTVSGSRRG
jgi:hypothetical protein